MDSYSRPIVLLIAAALLASGSGCVTTQQVDAPQSKMTAGQAREAIRMSLDQLGPAQTGPDWKFIRLKSARDVKFTRMGFSFTADDRETELPTESLLNFTQIKSLRIESDAMGLEGTYARIYMNSDIPLYIFKTPGDAMQFANAALVLRDAVATQTADQEVGDFAAFSTQAQAWLAATAKPEMSDEARTYKALAEDAISRKDFLGALDAYCEALERHPMWPEGHYNAALLAAETEDFGLAAKHMRRYLVLAPDAPDAASGKEKFLLWKHKAAVAGTRTPKAGGAAPASGRLAPRSR